MGLEGRPSILTSIASAGTLCDPDGELFIKPCTLSEIKFYEDALEKHQALADIIPVFMGMLRLNDATDMNSINEQLPAVAEHISTEMKEHVIEMIHEKVQEAAVAQPPPANGNVEWVPNKDRKITTDTAVVLENAAYGYKRPNIVDVKLGRRLWAEDAPLEKKRRFDKISLETTHYDLGFRIAGMRIYRGSEDKADLDEEDYRIYGKDFGRKDVNKDNVVEAFRKFIYNQIAGIDEDIARAVASAFLRDLKHVRDVLEKEETRMYSSSLLFIFEGDGEALRAAVEENNAIAAATVKDKAKSSLGRTTSRVDSGIDMGEDGELIIPGGVGGLSDDEEEEEEEEGDDDEVNLPKIFTLKLIDFAHADWVPGQGPDENLLLGVRSLVDIFEELSE